MQTTRYGSSQNGLQDTGSSRDEPDLEEMKSQFNDVFSLRKPKDARAGLSSGAKSIGKGVLAGVVGLVAAPVMMAREEGVKGFAKGVGAGASSPELLDVETLLFAHSYQWKAFGTFHHWSDEYWRFCSVTWNSVSPWAALPMPCGTKLLSSTRVLYASKPSILLAGVLGAAVLPVMGVGVGVTQMVRGVANTPEAIREAQRGKHWDTVRCLCFFRPYSATEEAFLTALR